MASLVDEREKNNFSLQPHVCAFIGGPLVKCGFEMHFNFAIYCSYNFELTQHNIVSALGGEGSSVTSRRLQRKLEHCAISDQFSLYFLFEAIIHWDLFTVRLFALNRTHDIFSLNTWRRLRTLVPLRRKHLKCPGWGIRCNVVHLSWKF